MHSLSIGSCFVGQAAVREYRVQLSPPTRLQGGDAGRTAGRRLPHWGNQVAGGQPESSPLTFPAGGTISETGVVEFSREGHV